MAHPWTSGACGVVVSVVLAGPCARIAGAQPASLVVHADNRAGVPPQVLETAKAAVDSVFSSAGVAIEWAAPRSAAAVVAWNRIGGRSRAVLVTFVAQMEGPEGTTEGALAIAMPALASAFVFYDRILDATESRPVDREAVLGRVIAHEIGHLLLTRRGHERYGLMSPDLDLDALSPHRFTGEEAGMIRSALEIRYRTAVTN